MRFHQRKLLLRDTTKSSEIAMPRYYFPSLMDREDTGSVNNRSTLCSWMATDDRSLYILTRSIDHPKRYVIETRRLPLSSELQGELFYDRNSEEDKNCPKSIQTELPDEVQDAFEIDVPIELICIEGEQWRATDENQNEVYERISCSLLLYTRKSVFLVNISHPKNIEHSGDIAMGQVISVYEPLDRYMHGSMEKSIIRIRKAPQCSNGFALVSPSSSFAALIEDIDTGEYSLVLRHSCGTVTSPLHFQLEDTEEDERITDFCFAQSLDELSLFSSISVLLLKGSGDVFSASPIVFDGSILSKVILADSRRYLTDRMNLFKDQNTAAWRHAKAATQFLVDVFSQPDNKSQFCTAQVLHQPDRSAAMWPTKLQGPILFHSEIDPGPQSITIENFGGSECFVGIVVAKVAGKLDFACLSPTSLLPRFGFEISNDSFELDDALFGHASFVERVDLCSDVHSTSAEHSSICVARHPIVNNLLHYATKSAVFTISTNVMRIINRQLQGLPVEPIRTTAWVSLNSVEAIKGIAVPANAVHGHNLYIGFSKKDVALIDLSEESYLHEFDALFHRSVQNEPLLLLENDTSSTTGTPLFSDIQPLVEKIQAGLSNMGKFVGSNTNYMDITPDVLAVALQTKKRCDSEIVVPLLELKRILDKHRATIMDSLTDQEVQLQEAKDAIKKLKARMTAMGERLEVAKANAISLSERSLTVLETSQKLLPTITEAEYDYFQMVKRMNIKCTQLESYVRKLNDLVVSRYETLDESTIAESVEQMDKDIIEQANSLLLYEDEKLNAIRSRLTKTEKITHDMVKEIGLTNQVFLQI